MKEVESLIIQARLEGLSFSQLNEVQLRLATDKIIIHGSAIAGSPMPNTEGFAEAIHEELVFLINDFGYSELTLAEILLAFQVNLMPSLRFPSGVESEYIPFSGSCFNVDFVSKILSKYTLFRNILNRKLENLIDGYE